MDTEGAEVMALLSSRLGAPGAHDLCPFLTVPSILPTKAWHRVGPQ